MPSCPMFPQVEPLPGTQSQLARRNWHHLTRARNRAACMGGHVICAFVVMAPSTILGRKLGNPSFEVNANRRIGILLDEQARGRVLNENRAQSGRDAALPDELIDLLGHIHETLAVGDHFERSLGDGHEISFGAVPWSTVLRSIQWLLIRHEVQVPTNRTANHGARS